MLSRTNSEYSEMSSLVDPSMISDDDFDTNDETLVADNDMEPEIVSKFERPLFFIRFRVALVFNT